MVQMLPDQDLATQFLHQTASKRDGSSKNQRTHKPDGGARIKRRFEDLDCDFSVAVHCTMNVSEASTTEVCSRRRLEPAQVDEDGVWETLTCGCDLHE
jgi:hypothetical protein